jgi:hypothetical protein
MRADFVRSAKGNRLANLDSSLATPNPSPNSDLFFTIVIIVSAGRFGVAGVLDYRRGRIFGCGDGYFVRTDRRAIARMVRGHFDDRAVLDSAGGGSRSGGLKNDAAFGQRLTVERDGAFDMGTRRFARTTIRERKQQKREQREANRLHGFNPMERDCELAAQAMATKSARP